MSIRNHYHRETIPYNPQSFRFSSNNVRPTRLLSTSSECGDADEEEEDIETPDISSSLDINSIGINSHELEIETDISSDDLRFSPSQLLSPSEVESQQFSYLSLPELHLLDLQQSTSGRSEGSKHRSPSASPAYSIESVAIDLETDDNQTEDIHTEEEVEDETESTNWETENDDEFVNMWVKIETKPYPTKAMKVTVSVQPPSEVEEDMDELYDKFDDELLSVSASGDIYSESEIESESQQTYSEESGGESEEEECHDGGSDSGEGNDVEDSANSGESDEEEVKEDSDDTQVTVRKNIAIVSHSNEGEDKTEEGMVEILEIQKEPKDETEQMLDLLSAAIDDSEKSKLKIIEKANLQNIQVAEAIAIAEGEKLALAVQHVENKTSSPLGKIKGLGESMVSGMKRAVSSSERSAEDKISPNGVQGKYLVEKVKQDVTDVKEEIEGSVASIEKELATTVAGTVVSIDNAKTQVKELDKRIYNEASTIIAGEISKVGETSGMQQLHDPTTTPTSSSIFLPSKPIESLLNEAVPPPNALIVASVIVHETPKSSQSPKTSPKSINIVPNAASSSISTATANINVIPRPEENVTTDLATVASVEIQKSPVQSSVPSGQMNVPDNSPKSNDTKFPEKDDYLSVYAADSMDSSEDDEDNIFRVHKTKTKEESAEERKAVEIAKDKLMEDWLSTRKESIEEVDDKFQHILEDMVSELHLEPVIPVLPSNLKEAVHVSDQGSKNASSATSSRQSSEHATVLTAGESFEDGMVFKHLVAIPEVSDSDSVHSYGYFLNIDDRRRSPLQQVQSSSSEFSKQNSIDSQQSLNSPSFNSSSRELSKQNSTDSQQSLSSPSFNSSSRELSKQNSTDSQQSLKSSYSNASRTMSSKSVQSPKCDSASIKSGRYLSRKSNTHDKGQDNMPPTKLGTPQSRPQRTPSAISTKRKESEQPASESQNSVTPIKKLTRSPSTNSLKSPKLPTPNKMTQPKSSVSPVMSKFPASPTLSISQASKSNPDLETFVAKDKKSVDPISTTSNPKSPTNSSSKITIPSSPNAKPNDEKTRRSPSLSSIGPKSPSISQHSSLQDHSVEEINYDGESNYLSTFIQANSDSESIHRDEDSPSQRRKWKNSTEIAATLSHYLQIIKTETVENCVTEVIPLLTQLLVMSRKKKSDYSLPTLISTLSATRVLCERLLHVKILSGEKALRNMDLSWLIRILCKLSADPESKLKPEASFTLARLVKAAGPELITRPIYFLLVMESDGHGHKKGSQGSKTKAAALDTLTYALLSFPKEEFDDLEEIARWVCLVVMHPHRRVRQAAMECIAVLGNRVGSPDAAISRFRGYVLYEVEQQNDHSDSDGSNAAPKSAIKSFDGKGIFDVSAIAAISCRMKKRILPLPSPQGLVEYGVKVPTGQELVLILTKMQEQEEDEYEWSTSDDSVHSSKSNDHHSGGDSESDSIRMSDLEDRARVGGKKSKVGKDEVDDVEVELITPDVAYVLAGKGRVCRQDLLNLDDENINEQETSEQSAKEKKKKALLRKKMRQKKRHVERTYSEYEDDSPGEA